ncbi:MAG: hypothetical protein DRO11_04230 [Methanobacteriota archaeon]|nr:MAG: hypothetical protein DRO11_04230 [Euryarchaeota archaeon]
MLNQLFGPSIHLLILDHFLENPEKLMNLREIARATEKNPGSISRVLPRLIKAGLIKQIKIGKATHIYKLNTENEVVQLIAEFTEKYKNLKSKQEKQPGNGEENAPQTNRR